MERKCEFSSCRRYRYVLWREWDLSNKSYLLCIGLNPSTADETNDDPTIRRVIGFAKRWGFGALCMTNIFAWRDTLPKNMRKAEEPIGEFNDLWINACARGSGMILAAWGAHGSHLNRFKEIAAVVEKPLYCLGTNQDKSPKHPLYIASDTRPVLFSCH